MDLECLESLNLIRVAGWYGLKEQITGD